jgi:hypothetical protein
MSFRTVHEFIAYAKANPGKLTMMASAEARPMSLADYSR